MEFWKDITFTTVYQIVSGVLALLGFTLSLIQFVLKCREKRRNIDFCIVNVEQQVDLFLLTYWADNKSTKPISILNVQLVYNKKSYNLIYAPIISRDIPNISDDKGIYNESSDKTPVLLYPNAAHGGILAFKISHEITKNIKNPTLVITTSVGKPITHTFILDQAISIKRNIKSSNRKRP